MATAAEIRRQMEKRMAAEAAAAAPKAPPPPPPPPKEDKGLLGAWEDLVKRRTNDVEETSNGKTSTRKYR